MEPEKLRMTLKVTNPSSELEIEFVKGCSLEELKQVCCDKLGEQTEIKLIFKGKILKSDQDVALLELGQKLYLVKEQKKQIESPGPVPISSGAGNMAGMLHGLNHFGVMNQARSMLNDIESIQGENDLQIDPGQMAMMSQMMSNPATRDLVFNYMQQMMGNPQMREMMINSNPTLKRLAESNPGVLDMMSNPMVIEQMKGMMQRMSLGNSAGPLSGDASSFPAPGGAPEGSGSVAGQPQGAFNPFSLLMPSQGSAPSSVPNQGAPQAANQFPFFNPFMQPANNPSPANNPPPQQPANPFLANPFFSMMQGMQNNPPPQQAQNPFAANPFLQMMANMNPPPNSNPPPRAHQQAFNPYENMFNMSNYTQNRNPSQNPRDQYATQLQAMKDMGFINEEANLKALQATGGNVNAAVERLLSILG